MKELFMELWTKYRKCSLFAFGMVCFLATGLLVWALPEKPEPPAARAEQTEETAAFLVSQDAPSSSSENAREKNAREKKEGEERSGEKSLDDRWFLYVTGNVRKPGVYRLSPGARLVHLVEAAGGLNNFADPTAVNLAASLEDGMHVHLPKKESGRRSRRSFWRYPFLLRPPLRIRVRKFAVRKFMKASLVRRNLPGTGTFPMASSTSIGPRKKN